LSKNLAQVEKLLAIKDEKKFSEAVVKYMEEMQPGMSTRVTSGLTEPEKDALLGKLHTLKSTDMTMDTPSGASSSGYLDEIDLELAQRLDDLKAKSESAKGLSEREYAELKVLMDEVELNTNQTIAPSFKSGEIPQTKDTNTLETEAKKYKSAEEFVKAQGKPVYHGTNVDFTEFKKTIKAGVEQTPTEQPIFVTKDTGQAKAFSKNGKVIDAVIRNDAKIFDGKEVYKDLKGGQTFDETDLFYSVESEFKKTLSDEKAYQATQDVFNFRDGNWDIRESTPFQNWLKNNGYDGFTVLEDGSEGIAVINLNKLKTKSQLTDIWNKTNGK